MNDNEDSTIQQTKRGSPGGDPVGNLDRIAGAGRIADPFRRFPQPCIQFHHLRSTWRRLLGRRWECELFYNNRGEIVGVSIPLEVGGPNPDPGEFAFLFENGTFTDVEVPGAAYTELDEMNNQGVAVGGYILAPFSLFRENFFVRGADGTITLLPPIPPGAGGSAGNIGINDEGTIVGTFTLTPDATSWPFGLQGFILKDGDYQVYNYPGAAQTALIAINSRGTIAGWWQVDSSEQHGFLLDKHGTLAPWTSPGPPIQIPTP
jgi:hypothetical protein